MIFWILAQLEKNGFTTWYTGNNRATVQATDGTIFTNQTIAELDKILDAV